MDERHEFQLSAKEFEFLKQLASRNESLAGLLRSSDGTHDRRMTVRLSCAEAEQLRDCLTTKLAEVGFDENYSPNEKGDMLERLIDKFYLP